MIKHALHYYEDDGNGHWLLVMGMLVMIIMVMVMVMMMDYWIIDDGRVWPRKKAMCMSELEEIMIMMMIICLSWWCYYHDDGGVDLMIMMMVMMLSSSWWSWWWCCCFDDDGGVNMMMVMMLLILLWWWWCYDNLSGLQMFSLLTMAIEMVTMWLCVNSVWVCVKSVTFVTFVSLYSKYLWNMWVFPFYKDMTIILTNERRRRRKTMEINNIRNEYQSTHWFWPHEYWETSKRRKKSHNAFISNCPWQKLVLLLYCRDIWEFTPSWDNESIEDEDSCPQKKKKKDKMCKKR